MEPIDSRVLEREYKEKMASQTPNHPITDEQGSFSRFLDGTVRPVYTTPNGDEFLHQDDWDERLKEAGADETIVYDNGFFATGDESLLPPLE